MGAYPTAKAMMTIATAMTSPTIPQTRPAIARPLDAPRSSAWRIPTALSTMPTMQSGPPRKNPMIEIENSRPTRPVTNPAIPSPGVPDVVVGVAATVRNDRIRQQQEMQTAGARVAIPKLNHPRTLARTVLGVPVVAWGRCAMASGFPLASRCASGSDRPGLTRAACRTNFLLPSPAAVGNFILIQKWGGAAQTARPRHRVKDYSPRYEPKAIRT